MKPFKKRKKTYTEEYCEGCGEPFPLTRRWRRFCSKKCQWKAWALNNPRQPSLPGKDQEEQQL